MTIGFRKDRFEVSLATGPDDVKAAQRLRYEVFVAELGGDGAGVDHDQRLEADGFDAIAEHLILRDCAQGTVVGVYRLLRGGQTERFYSEGEFDLSALKQTGRNLLELGRSCVAKPYRGGPAMFYLWAGLSQYIDMHDCNLVFGTASIPGTDLADLAPMLRALQETHLAPAHLRPVSKQDGTLHLAKTDPLDRRRAMITLPPLIKAYLRLGGYVGQGAFVDHAFNCTDLCMVLDTAALNDRQARLYREVTR